MKPLFWTKPAYELDPNDLANNGFINQDFLVWMRAAALPDFRKLYRRITEGDYAEGLPAGKYVLEIAYSILPWLTGSGVIRMFEVWVGGILCDPSWVKDTDHIRGRAPVLTRQYVSWAACVPSNIIENLLNSGVFFCFFKLKPATSICYKVWVHVLTTRAQPDLFCESGVVVFTQQCEQTKQMIWRSVRK